MMSAKYFPPAQKLQNRSDAVAQLLQQWWKSAKQKYDVKQSISFFPVVCNSDEIVQSPFLREKNDETMESISPAL
jgi:hypothetical protein